MTWSDPAILNTNGASDLGGDNIPQVTTDGAGNWIAVWAYEEYFGGTTWTDGDPLVAHSTDNGQTWSAPAVLNTNAASGSVWDNRTPQVTTDGAGNWLAVWSAVEDPGGVFMLDSDIFFATSFFVPALPASANDWMLYE